MSGIPSVAVFAEAAGQLDAAEPWLSDAVHRLTVAALIGGIGIWMMLPGSGQRVRRVGAGVAVVGGCFFFSVMPLVGNSLAQLLFWSLAALTAVAAVATITSRNPVYCAIWFALTLLGTGALFFVNGSQFLGVATVAVYAGAIVVTFLFVLMLSQPEGHAHYDRLGWGILPSIFAIVAGIGFVLLTSAAILHLEPPQPLASAAADTPAAARDTSGPQVVLQEQHVAALGAELFSRHLVAVQAAGALLLAALVGAVAIASAGRPSLAGRPLLGPERSGTPLPSLGEGVGSRE